jgi:hypothetical protein
MGAWMARGRSVVEPHPEPGRGRHREAAVGRVHLRREVDHLGHPRVGEVVEVLEDFVGAGRDGEVDVGRGADRPADVVRCE